jgi:cobalt-zinc-cadmium efflux system protein
VPPDIDLQELESVMIEVDGVDNIHHLHVWELDENNRALEAHVVLSDTNFNKIATLKKHIKKELKEQFNITHSTLEMEPQAEECSEVCIIK